VQLNRKYSASTLDFNRKYSLATLERLRFRFLSRAGVGDRALFALDERSGVLRTADRIDREAICPASADCFVAFDVAVHPMTYFQIVKVRVEIAQVTSCYSSVSRRPHRRRGARRDRRRQRQRPGLPAPPLPGER